VALLRLETLVSEFLSAHADFVGQMAALNKAILERLKN
jgi:hypothetical protein